MPSFDIAPFCLPNHPDDERRFEEPRDIERVIVTFAAAAPKRVALYYLRGAWPEQRIESSLGEERHRPANFGWLAIDDQFNQAWQKAAARVERRGARSVAITFQRGMAFSWVGCRAW